jgi:glycine/D-amino acid oxidase-like deaminating enzyme
MGRPHTIVVGAGVLGLSVANCLAVRGDRVTIVDRNAPGSGTSRTTFAWLNSNGKVPPSYQRLNVEGVARYRELVGAPATEWIHLNGRIQWAADADEIEALDRHVEEMRGQAYPVEAITAAAAMRLEPDLRIPMAAEVRLWPSEGFVVPQLLVAWLLARATAHGVDLVTGDVAGFEIAAGRTRGIRFADGSALKADRVLTCAGRWTESLLATAGVHVPMQPAVQGGPSLGLLGYTTPTPTRLKRTITGPGLNVRPDAEAGRYVLQGHALDHLAAPDALPAPDGDIGGEILARARAVLSGFDDARLTELRVGYRSVPEDRITVAGWAPGVEGLYIIATHSGITLALHLGELAATEVADGRDVSALTDFRPGRFDAALDADAIRSRPVH